MRSVGTGPDGGGVSGCLIANAVLTSLVPSTLSSMNCWPRSRILTSWRMTQIAWWNLGIQPLGPSRCGGPTHAPNPELPKQEGGLVGVAGFPRSPRCAPGPPGGPQNGVAEFPEPLHLPGEPAPACGGLPQGEPGAREPGWWLQERGLEGSTGHRGHPKDSVPRSPWGNNTKTTFFNRVVSPQ